MHCIAQGRNEGERGGRRNGRLRSGQRGNWSGEGRGGQRGGKEGKGTERKVRSEKGREMGDWKGKREEVIETTQKSWC
jgi:hypothetical protein